MEGRLSGFGARASGERHTGTEVKKVYLRNLVEASNVEPEKLIAVLKNKYGSKEFEADRGQKMTELNRGGKSAVRLDIFKMCWVSKSKIIIRAGSYSGGDSAGSVEFTLVKVKGEWIIETSDALGIS